MTVQDLIDWCDEHGRSPESTDVYVYADSSLGWMPAKIESDPWGGVYDGDICLDYC